MWRLAEHGSDGHFAYTQVERQAQLALYRQTHKATGATHWEVIRIRVAPAHTFPQGIAVPEREVYPPAKTWGTDGWAFRTREAAHRYMTQLLDVVRQGQRLGAA